MNGRLITRHSIEHLKMTYLHLRGAAFLAVLSLLPAVAADDIGKYIQVQSTTSERVGQFLRVKVQLRNTSAQQITAYTLGVSATYGTGKVAEGHITRDMVWTLVNQKMGYPFPQDVAFGPGQVTTSTVDVPIDLSIANPPDSSPTAMTSAEVTMVAFADKTAVGSETAIAVLMATRTNAANEARDLVVDLGDLRGAVDFPARLRDLISQAESRRAESKSPAAGLRESERLVAERRLAALKTYAAPLANSPDDLRMMTKAWQIRSEVMGEHSSLRRIEAAEQKQEKN